MAHVAPLACILLLLSGWQQQSINAHPILIAKEAIQFLFDVAEGFNNIKDLVENEDEENISEIDAKMNNKLNSISNNIQSLSTEMHEEFANLDNKLTTTTNALFTYFKNVDYMYGNYLRKKNNTTQYDHSSLQKFVDEATTSINKTLTDMHYVLTGSDVVKDGILSILANKTNTELMCIRNQSPQQLIQDFYNTVVEKEAKGLVVQLFAYKLKETWNKIMLDKNGQLESLEKKWFERERKEALNDSQSRINHTFDEVKRAMAAASRELWKCDPSPLKDQFFSKIQVFQAYVNFKRDFDNSNNLCANKCQERENVTSSCKFPFCEQHVEEKRCTGLLRDCVDIQGPGTLCHSPPNIDRRYEWLKTDPGAKYGQVKTTCYNKKSELVYEDAPLMQFFVTGKHTFNMCGFCLCTCANDRIDIDRYFSLTESISDTNNNMVVTGVRLMKDDHVLYIQIQQGHLEANGSINRSTVNWVPIQKWQYKKDSFFDNVLIKEKIKSELYDVTWDQNTVYLDEIEPRYESSKEHEVVTGLRFRKVDQDLKLEIMRTEFDYATGKLILFKSAWYSNNATRAQRTAVELEDSIIPIFVNNNKANSKSKSDEYVQFQITSQEKDLGQNTVPFIDLQEIVTNPPTPISGAGIFHRARADSGGFLALKLIHYDYTPHLENNN